MCVVGLVENEFTPADPEVYVTVGGRFLLGSSGEGRAIQFRDALAAPVIEGTAPFGAGVVHGSSGGGLTEVDVASDVCVGVVAQAGAAFVRDFPAEASGAVAQEPDEVGAGRAVGGLQPYVAAYSMPGISAVDRAWPGGRPDAAEQG